MEAVDIRGHMEAIAGDETMPEQTRLLAGLLAKHQESLPVATVQDEAVNVAVPIDPEFASLYADAWAHGAGIAGRSKIVIVGMARDVERQLPGTFEFIRRVGRQFREWAAVIVENDSTDNTKAMLHAFAADNEGRVTVECRDFGRERLRGFEAVRVQRYAEYRNRYSDIARELHPDADYVLAIDTDPESMSSHGIINGLGWLDAFEDAGGMASLSLYQAMALANRSGATTTSGHFAGMAGRRGWLRGSRSGFRLRARRRFACCRRSVRAACTRQSPSTLHGTPASAVTSSTSVCTLRCTRPGGVCT
jgi:hypothetical protein